MDTLYVCILGIIILLLFLSFGFYVGLALLFVGTIGVAIFTGFRQSISLMATTALHFSIDPSFVVLPIFVLMGSVAMYGGIGEAAYNSLRRLIGKLPGGLGVASIFGCAAFGTICSSSAVTAIVMSKIASPQMRRLGYEKSFAYGIVTSAGMIGMLIPPSMLAIVYALASGDSVGKLLMAGIGPGMLLSIIFSLGVVLMVKLRPSLAPTLDEEEIPFWKRLSALKDLWAIIIVGLIMIGGIYAGVFTANEAASFGVLVLLIISFSKRAITFRKIWNLLLETVATMGMVFLLMIGSKIFALFMTLAGVAQFLVNVVTAINLLPWQFLIFMMVIYLILGCFFDTFSMIMLTIPLIRPIVDYIGIDPIWFAMVAIMTIEVGLITPPIGFNVFSVQTVAESDVTLTDIFKGTMPFVLMSVISIVIVIFVPQIATFIPNTMLK